VSLKIIKIYGAVKWIVAGIQTPQDTVTNQYQKYRQKQEYLKYKYQIVYLSINYGTEIMYPET
jgi:hypothetical protein